MSDSLLERFGALAPADGRADWDDVVRRARPRGIRVPVAVAVAAAALVVAAPAVALIELLRPEADPPLVGSVWIQIVPWGSTNLVGMISGEVYDDRVRTMVLAFEGRPQRRHAVGPELTFLFRLSKKDFGRCGKLHALDRHGSRIGVIPLPRIPRVPPKPPPGGRVVVRPAPPPIC
jgi:hypothetical protein